MPKVVPFKAVRPTRDKVGLVATRSYEDYSEKGRDMRMANNPFSFLHITNPGFKYDKKLSGEARFKMVKNRYSEFKEEHIFLKEETPAFYVYRIENRDKDVFTGIIGGASTADYAQNRIKKHEETLAHREETFKNHLKTVGFNAEPVLLTHPEDADLSQLIEKIVADKPEYEFTTTYRDTHYLWPVHDADLIDQIQARFAKMNAFYIADGHHRCASSHLLSEELSAENPGDPEDAPYNYFMSYIIPESHLRIHAFNRLVKDLNGLSKEEFLVQLDESFRIENLGVEYYKPKGLHQFSMYLDGEFYALHLRKALFNFKDPLEKLDVQVLYDTVLKPVLGIEDVRTNTRMDYSHGKNDMPYIKGKVDSGEFAVGFGMLPINIDELKQIADENLTMPPKTTYIEPKLRSGITVYEF